MGANIRHQLYFEPSKRSSKARSRFIGLYTDKGVRYVASIGTVVTGVCGSDGFVVNSTEKGALTREETERIEGAIRELDGCFESFSRVDRRFYLFDELHRTNFVKSSKYGLWGARNFVLSRWLNYASKKQYSTAEAAAALDGQEWE